MVHVPNGTLKYAHLASPGTPARSRRRPRPRHRDRRPEPAPARRGDRHQPPDAHLPLQLPGRLLAAVTQAVQEQQRAALLEPGATLPDSRRSWRRLSDPSLWPQERLFFELYASAQRGRPGTEGFLDGIVESWVAPVAAALVTAGRRTDGPGRRPARRGRGPRPAARSLATGDRAGVDEAYDGSSSTCRPRRPRERQTPAATALEDARPRQPGIRSRAPAVVPPAPRVASRWQPPAPGRRYRPAPGPPGHRGRRESVMRAVPRTTTSRAVVTSSSPWWAPTASLAPPHRVRGGQPGRHRSRSVRRSRASCGRPRVPGPRSGGSVARSRGFGSAICGIGSLCRCPPGALCTRLSHAATVADQPATREHSSDQLLCPCRAGVRAAPGPDGRGAGCSPGRASAVVPAADWHVRCSQAAALLAGQLVAVRLAGGAGVRAEGKRTVLRDGSEVLIRPVQGADAPLLAGGFARLSAG